MSPSAAALRIIRASSPPTDIMEGIEEELKRMSFQECMELSRLPADGSSKVQRFVSRQPAWKPGGEKVWGKLRKVDPRHTSGNSEKNVDPMGRRTFGPGAFGGHVYAQAPLAAARVVQEEDQSTPECNKLAIHSIQGVFSNPGLTDRPFVYEVSNVSSSRSFSTRLITARQPSQPSSNPTGPFPTSDAQLPLGEVVFSCLTTFKRPVQGPAEVQDELSPQKRFADILNSRPPDEWEVSPQADIDFVREMFPVKGHGDFPILDMYKVDMAEFNKGKPLPERRQVVLYRLHKPLPREDVNAHIVTHAYEADRNGLIMLGNHLGYGYNMGPVASLTYAFYVHGNPEDAVMEGDGWWVQEVWWPRVSAGRGLQETKIWSPEGKHVASGYQEGIIMPAKSSKAKM